MLTVSLKQYTGFSSSPSSVTLTRYNPRRSSLDYNDSDNESLSSVKSITSTSSSSYLYSPISRRRKYNLNENNGLNQQPGYVCGLTNLGNTCYMNAVLQALYATPTLRDFVMRNQREPLMTALGNLFENMENPNNSTLSPNSFRSQFTRRQLKFRGYEQQDAQEFLRFLLNELHEEINDAKKRPKAKLTGSPRTSSEAWLRYKTIDDSRFIDMLAGLLSSTIECSSCGNKSTCWDPFWDLSLPLPRSSSDCTVEHCLKEFTALEELTSGEMAVCDNCKRPTESTKRLSIEKAPSVLILHLKRFSNEGYKLSLPKVIPNEKLYVKSRCYSLYAVVVHQGSSSRSGHYTAYCMHSSKWYYFNDERVSEVKNFSSSNIEDAYILFYMDTSYTSRL